MKRRWRGSFSDLGSLQEEAYRLVDESLEKLGDFWQGRGSEIRPRADIYEDDERFTLFIELPGLSRDEINLSIVGRRFTVTGEKKKPDQDELSLRIGERSFGKCHRKFVFDSDIDPDSITAKLTDGVLKVEITKKLEAEARKIEIKVG